MSHRALSVIAGSTTALLWIAPVFGQEIQWASLPQPLTAEAAMPVRVEYLPDGSRITIISERTIPAVQILEPSVLAANPSEPMEAASPQNEALTSAPANPNQAEPVPNSLIPGGEIWQKLLSQEIDKARLEARIELETAKFELYREHMQDRLVQMEKELMRRTKELEAREHEAGQQIHREQENFERQRHEMEQAIGGLQERLEVAKQETLEVKELRKMLEMTQSKIVGFEQERQKLMAITEKHEKVAAEAMEKGLATAERLAQTERQWKQSLEEVKQDNLRLKRENTELQAAIEAAKQKLAEHLAAQEKEAAKEAAKDESKAQPTAKGDRKKKDKE